MYLSPFDHAHSVRLAEPDAGGSSGLVDEDSDADGDGSRDGGEAPHRAASRALFVMTIGDAEPVQERLSELTRHPVKPGRDALVGRARTELLRQPLGQQLRADPHPDSSAFTQQAPMESRVHSQCQYQIAVVMPIAQHNLLSVMHPAIAQPKPEKLGKGRSAHVGWHIGRNTLPGLGCQCRHWHYGHGGYGRPVHPFHFGRRNPLRRRRHQASVGGAVPAVVARLGTCVEWMVGRCQQSPMALATHLHQPSRLIAGLDHWAETSSMGQHPHAKFDLLDGYLSRLGHHQCSGRKAGTAP